ncbi:MAG TPA: hypothetical protein VEY71_11595, partial [Chitinophagales bacterium]|nr:hypothetical protein [Chitinophagales bacterium]
MLTLLLLLTCGLTLSAQTLTSDRDDYWPGATATLSGSGFQPGESVVLVVEELTGGIYNGFDSNPWTVTADASGNFTTTWHVCNACQGSSMVDHATGLSSGANADVYFTDSQAVLDQARNGTATSPISPMLWVNGNLNSNQAHYVEGYSVPYRMVISGLVPGTHTVTIEWDTKQSGKNAIDYITHYDNIEPHITQFGHASEDILPLAGTGLAANTPFSLFPIPAPASILANGSQQPLTSFNALNAAKRQMTLFNGTITGITYAGQDNLAINANASSSVTVTFTTTNTLVVLAWGGHIAAAKDWGTGNGAGSLPGSPYHMRLIDLDGSGGNQDRSLAAAAVATAQCNLPGAYPTCPNNVSNYSAATGLGWAYAWDLLNNTSGAFFTGGTTGSTVTTNSGPTVG